jgi:hypothetical protein
MNTRKTLILAIILAIAVGIIVLANYISNRKPSDDALLFISAASNKSISAVIIKDAQNLVKLQRKGEVWEVVSKDAFMKPAATEKGLSGMIGAETPGVPTYPADSAMISQMLDNLAKLKKEVLISENPAKQAMFEVDTLAGCHIEVFGQNGLSLGAVVLGKSGPDYSSIYVRAKNAKSVYQVPEVSRTTFPSDHKRWTDKSVLKFDKTQATKLTLTKKGSPAMVIVKGDTTRKNWQILEPSSKKGDTAQADSLKVDEILTALSTLTAADYEDRPLTDSATGLTDPSIRIAVTLANGTVRDVLIGNKNESQDKFWIRVPDKKFLYLMNDFDQKKFDKIPADFISTGLKPIEAVPAPIPEKYRKKK